MPAVRRFGGTDIEIVGNLIFGTPTVAWRLLVKVGDLVKKTWGSTLKIGDIGIIVAKSNAFCSGEVSDGWWHVAWLTRGQDEIINWTCFEVINESR